MEKGEKEQKKRFWNAARIVFVLFLVVGILVGAIIEHFFVEEHFFTSGLKSKLQAKTNELKLMEENFKKCIDEKAALEQTCK